MARGGRAQRGGAGRGGRKAGGGSTAGEKGREPQPAAAPRRPRRAPVAMWAVFLFSMGVVLASFVSVMFPALILASDPVTIPGIDPVVPDPYEAGVWSGGVVASSAIIFGLLLLYLRGRLPGSVSSAIGRVFSFEVSGRVALACMAALLAAYVAGTVPEMSTEERWEDYKDVRERLEAWSPDQIAGSFEPHVRYLLLHSSMELFGSYKVVPFMASVALLITTYLVTAAISRKRFAGIVSVVVLMQSSVFLTYDTSVAYTNFWILFYLASLYLVHRTRLWPLSPVAYLLSIPSKALTAAFLPMSVYFVLRSEIPARRRAVVAAVTASVVAAGGVAVVAVGGDTAAGEAAQERFDAREFWTGFSSFASQLRFDGLVMLFMVPLVVGLFLVCRNGGVRHGESVMVLIAGMLLIAPVLTGFTNQTNQPYRFVPLVVFFAVGVGVLLSRRSGAVSRALAD